MARDPDRDVTAPGTSRGAGRWVGKQRGRGRENEGFSRDLPPPRPSSRHLPGLGPGLHFSLKLRVAGRQALKERRGAGSGARPALGVGAGGRDEPAGLTLLRGSNLGWESRRLGGRGRALPPPRLRRRSSTSSRRRLLRAVLTGLSGERRGRMEEPPRPAWAQEGQERSAGPASGRYSGRTSSWRRRSSGAGLFPVGAPSMGKRLGGRFPPPGRPSRFGKAVPLLGLRGERTRVSRWAPSPDPPLRALPSTLLFSRRNESEGARVLPSVPRSPPLFPSSGKATEWGMGTPSHLCSPTARLNSALSFPLFPSSCLPPLWRRVSEQLDKVALPTSCSVRLCIDWFLKIFFFFCLFVC